MFCFLKYERIKTINIKVKYSKNTLIFKLIFLIYKEFNLNSRYNIKMSACTISFNLWWSILDYEIRNFFIVETVNRSLATKLRNQTDSFRYFLKEKFLLKDTLHFSYEECKESTRNLLTPRYLAAERKGSIIVYDVIRDCIAQIQIDFQTYFNSMIFLSNWKFFICGGYDK